jgi:hypothetical protein
MSALAVASRQAASRFISPSPGGRLGRGDYLA